MPYTRPEFDGVLLNFRLFLKLRSMQVGLGPGATEQVNLPVPPARHP